MTIKIVGPRLLVKQDKIEDRDPDSTSARVKAAKAAGLEVIQSVDKETMLEQAAQVYGTLIAIGSRSWFPPVGDGTPWAKVGDRVQYAKYAGAYTKDPETGEKYTILNDEDIIAVIEGEKSE
ncbi:MAG: hypothetical protein NUV80_06440 [Candidatus Berkelbacteria bacterium]|nr:hypothetical protein [Candidatus Berkelbacteria bacterium]